MNTRDFISILQSNLDKKLVFEYREGSYIAPTYHITEVKNAVITSVDCGGFKHEFNETIVQLMVNPSEVLKEEFTARKAIGIMNIVEDKFSMAPEANIIFEYGDLETPTANYRVKKVHIRKDMIVVKLYVPGTVCKPSEAGILPCC